MIRPFEIATQHLPQQAGKATIRWSTREDPRREGALIILPLGENVLFLPLKGGEQFIWMKKFTPYGSRTEQAEIFFGGTDENPFLVQLASTVEKTVLAIPEKGEDVFYELLKPQRVKFLEKTLGKSSKRQGDIFAMEVGWEWREMRTLASLIGLVLRGDETKTCEGQVFGTRHVLKGRCVEAVTFEPESGWDSGRERTQVTVQRTLFVTGVLRQEPDHSPLELRSVHLLEQVGVLARPHEAD